MAIVLGIPTRNQFEFVFNRLLPSVLTGTVVPDTIRLWDNSDGLQLPQYVVDHGIKALDAIAPATANKPPVNISIDGTGRNECLAAVWNTIIHNCADDDTIILANDDLEVLPDTIEKLHASSAPFAYPAGARAGNSFSLFRIDKLMWNTVGPFDPNFVPAYFEDNDYHRRMRLLGFDITPITDAEYIHVGSATLQKFTPEQQAQFHMYFRRNETYYIFKWGGKPGHELYEQPFNGQDPIEAAREFNAGYMWR